jgi:hypothetical protein
MRKRLSHANSRWADWFSARYLPLLTHANPCQLPRSGIVMRPPHVPRTETKETRSRWSDTLIWAAEGRSGHWRQQRYPQKISPAS